MAKNVKNRNTIEGPEGSLLAAVGAADLAPGHRQRDLNSLQERAGGSQ